MNKSNLIEDSATQIWNLIEKRTELVQALDPVNIFNKPPEEDEWWDYFFDVAWKIETTNLDYKKLDDEYKYLLLKLEKHGIGLEVIEDLLHDEYWIWEEGLIWDLPELFLRLPAEHVFTKLLSLSKSFDQEDPITDLYWRLSNYDRAPLNGISSKDKRLEAWRSWYRVNVLKTEGNN